MLRTRLQWSGPVTGPGVATMFWGATEDSAGVASVRSAIGAFTTAIAGQLSTSTGYSLETEVAIVDEANGNVTGTLATTALTGAGSNAGAQLPWATQWLLRWRTGDFVDGREVRGRTFLPGPNNNGQLNGKPTTAALAAINAAGATLVADEGAGFGIWRRNRDADTRYDPRTGEAITIEARTGSFHRATTASCWTNFAQLRSRRD